MNLSAHAPKSPKYCVSMTVVFFFWLWYRSKHGTKLERQEQKLWTKQKWWLIFFNVNDERELFYHVMVLHDLHLLLKDGGVDNYLFFRRVSRNCNRSCKTWYGIHFVTIPPFQKNHNHPHYLPCKSSENR